MPRDLRFILKTHYVNSRALIIGINDYVKASPLGYAVNDAEELQRALVEDLKFPHENVTLLKNGEATRERILKHYLGYASPAIELDERLIIFFAGHGYTRMGSRGEVGYLVPYDGDPSELSTLIRWDDLTRNAELIRAKHVLFIMDACYGGLAVTRNLSPGSARFLKDMMLRYSRQVLTAGKADEVVADSGGPLPGHSVFTGHLLEGIRGKAVTEDGVLTASSLTAYVHAKVGKDQNSQQTPHYGWFDGDGDCVLIAPQLEKLEEDVNADLDALLVVPVGGDVESEETSLQKVGRAKRLLASEATTIELHDFVIQEVRRFLADTSEDHFKVQAPFSAEGLLDRIERYNAAVNNLSLVLACISHWAQPPHKNILQKALARSTDYLERRAGLTLWINLRWYPTIVELYCAGIAALAGDRFDSLAHILGTAIGDSTYPNEDRIFGPSVAEAILELNRQEAFKVLPGHEQNFAPLSEYLFKSLQPRLDDALFLGKSYERLFDEFEMLFATTTAVWRKEHRRSFWGPYGRFAWKHGRDEEQAPLRRLIADATAQGDAWNPVKAGLFGGNVEKFKQAAAEFETRIAGLGWL